MNKIVKQDFPMYDQLVKDALNLKEQPNSQKMSALVNALESDKLNQAMALILHHSIVNGNYIQGKTPYGGKIFDGTKGVRYQIKDLPSDLCKILWIFIDGPMLK